MKLFIVESPTKAKTIQRYLGRGFKVKATLGHIKDLPPKELGVDEESLKAKYVYLRGKRKIVEQLKKLAEKSDEVYIGTDPDREGEAIAFFLKQELVKVNDNLKRVRFYEITPEALKNSISEGGDLDINLVHAQFSRRVLDRLIGYKLSPKLWRAFRDFKLSAGRVQSPTLMLIVDREKEIQNFKSKSYYYVMADAQKDGIDFTLIYDYRYEKPSDAKDIAKRIEGGLFTVLEVIRKEEKVQPPKPFITSTLQAEANAKLGFPVEKTQKLAQILYEMGLITYPRTDSYRMNSKKAREFIAHIRTEFGDRYAGRLRQFQEKATAQGAHECIRPTGIKEPSLKGDLALLYKLIRNRTLASLMSPALIERVSVNVLVESENLKRPIRMVSKGTSLLFDGWCRVYRCNVELKEFPELEVGEILNVNRVYVHQKKTKPPPRYTEGSLIKTLEKLGIGRPSTYATLVRSLKSKGYIRKHKGSLIPTERAFWVVDFLKENFPSLMDYNFTALMERELDSVEKGNSNWKEVVRKYFNKVVDTL